MTSTYATSWTSTYSEASVRHAMARVLVDLTAMKNAGLITPGQVEKWHDDLLFVLLAEAGELFQIKITAPGRATVAIEYRVADDGRSLQDSRAGGINFEQFPKGTSASVVLQYRENAPSVERVRKYLASQGWGTNGHLVQGDAAQDRVYAKNNCGLTRGKIGDWT